MIRILFFVLVIVASALGLAWLADRPGTVTLEWLGYEIKTSAFVAALIIAAIVAAVILLWALLRYVWTRPAAVAKYMSERNREHGYEALSKGLLAVGVGDRTQAQRYAGIASRHLPREPLTALLRAQSAQLRGDPAKARRAFEAMLERPETHLLGVRGLYLEAQRENNEDAAMALAEEAVKRDPKLAWGVNALFDLQARTGDWEGALDTLAIARQNGHVDTDTAKRRRAVLLTAEARETETFDPDKALTLANEALRLAPSLVPAAELAGRILTSKGEARAASKHIVRTWKLSPHPDLAMAYAFAKPGLSSKDRLKRVEYLAGLTPDDIEGHIALAQAALDAQEWDTAREALAHTVEDRPSARICTLMARIEGGSGDKGREREWLARAVRAPRDRAWIADGYISDRWLPVSPVTGAVDAFEWKAPADAIGRGDDTLMIEEYLEPPRDASAIAVVPPHNQSPSDRADAEPDVEPAVVVDVAPAATEEESADDKRKSTPAPVDMTAAEEKPPETTEKASDEGFLPSRPPDDPGVGADSDDGPSPLERLRAAQIRWR
jgi:HemY protein